MRGWYRILDQQATLQNMVRAETVDFAWIVALSVFIFFITQLGGRLLSQRNPAASRRLISFAPYAAAVVWLDGVENAFSLLMLSDPWGFPDWLAYAHAGTSWLKMAGLAAVAVGTPTYALASAIRIDRQQLASAER